MQALVTGSNGFIGASLVKDLICNGIQVRCLIRKTSNLKLLQDMPVEYVYGDLCLQETLIDAVSGMDMVFHLGGVTRGKNEQDYYNNNTLATLNLLNACRQAGTPEQKFIFISSQAAGGPSANIRPVNEDDLAQPISAYGKSKLMAEHHVLEFSRERPAVIIRPPSVYGPGDKDFFILFKNIDKRFAPMIGNGEQRISIVYISDLIEGIQLAAKSPAAQGEIFYICDDQDVSFSQVIAAIAHAIEKKPLVLHLPLFLVEWIAVFLHRYSQITRKSTILNKDKVNEMRQSAWVCTNIKAKKLLGFRPKVDLEEGMRLTAAWYKEQKWLK
ncbi:MAG: NAD-dependent epimerase/dehydratase family protein [Calditrichaeota bacterium]|nr:MAG: NAD-dependent epimerase/dehydratase family protein [Calditrichota bacterium]